MFVGFFPMDFPDATWPISEGRYSCEWTVRGCTFVEDIDVRFLLNNWCNVYKVRTQATGWRRAQKRLIARLLTINAGFTDGDPQ